MASIRQLVSEFAHSLGQPNNRVLRENIRSLIIHTRNEVIRHSYENHGYVDKVLTQRFMVSLTDVNDGDIKLPEDYYDVDVAKIKRTLQKVPRAIRLTNNLPFDRVSSAGFYTSKVFPFIKETSARFRKSVPGLCATTCYDYINEYIYLFPPEGKSIDIAKIVIESAFEHPNYIQQKNADVDEWRLLNDDNEWLLSEDMIGQIKEIIYKRDLLSTVRETDEVDNRIKYQ